MTKTRSRLIMIWCLLFGNQCFAQAADAVPEIQTFRRVYTPQWMVRKMDRVLQNYISMERTRFERIVASIRRGLPQEIERGVYLQRAVYRGRYENGSLVDGIAQLSFDVEGQNPVEFDLGFLSLALSNPTWSNGLAAQIGTSNEGRMVLFVPKTDTLNFNWNLRGKVSKQNTSEVELNLTSSRINRLIIETPADVALRSSHGVQSQVTDGNHCEWTIDLGTNSSFTLAFGEVEKNYPETFVNQVSTYRIQQNGSTLTTNIQIDGHPNRSPRIIFELDGQIEPTDVQLNERKCEWTSSISTSGRKRNLVIHLPPQADSENPRHRVQITGFLPAVFGANWRLPAIRAGNARTLQERLFLSVKRPMTLANLSLKGCRQLKLSDELDLNDQDVMYSFQVVDNDEFQIDVFVEHERYEFKVTTFNKVTASESEIRSTIESRISASRGSTFQIEMDVADRWEIESLELKEASSVGPTLDRWSSPVDGKLLIELRRPLQSGETVRFVSNFRRSFGSKDAMFTDEILPLSFPRAIDHERLLSLSAQSPYQIKWNLTGLSNWLTEEQVVSLSNQFNIGPDESILKLGEQAVGLPFELTQSRSGFRSQVNVLVNVSSTTVQQRIGVTIIPDASAITEVTIQNSENVDFQWHLLDGQTRRPLLSPKFDSTGKSRTSKLMLDEPQTSEFTIYGERSLGFASQINVPVASVLGGTSQKAEVQIVADRNSPISISAPSSMIRQAAPSLDTNDDAKVHYNYTYIPENEVGNDSANSIVIRSEAVSGNCRASIWRVEPVTSVDHLGVCRHLVKAFVENYGNSSIDVTIPEGLEIAHIDVQRQRIDLPATIGEILSIPLSPHQRFVLIELEFQATASMVGLYDRQVVCPQIGFSAPILQKNWRVWLAPGTSYQTFEAEAEKTVAARLLSRFFGPFSRMIDAEPFNFFSEQSWFNLTRASHVNETRQSIELFLQTLMEETSSQTDQTWAGVIKKFDGRNRIAKTRTLISPFIDKRSLALRGILPTTPFPKLESKENILQELDIAILAAGRRVILTTVDAIGLFSDDMVSTENPRIVLVKNHGDEGAISRLLRLRIGPLVNVVEWMQSDIQEKWVDDSSHQDVKLLCGWSLLSVNPDQVNHTLQFYSHQSVWRVTGVVFLLAAGLGWWIAARSFAMMIAAISTSTMLCLLMPSSFVTVGSALFWGIMAGGGFHWMRTRTDFSRLPYKKTNTTSHLGQIGTMLVLLILVATIDELTGEELKPSENRTIQNVFIPIDDDGNPTATYVRLPRDLDEKLVRYEAVSSGRSTKWMVRSANYQASLEDRADGQGPQIDVIRARFKLEVFADDTSIDLRLPGDAIESIDPSGRLDQIPILLTVDRPAKTISCDIRDKGIHYLDLEFRPQIESNNNISTATLPLLAVPTSRLQVSTFLDLESVKIKSALGQVERLKQQAKILADLGPANVLTIEWPGQNRFMTRSLQVVQSTLMSISLDVVNVSTRFRFKIDDDEPLAFNLLVDDRLDLVHVNESFALAEQVIDTSPVGLKRYIFRSRPGVSGDIYADFLFRYGGVSGLGGIRFPKIELENFRVDSRLLGVSVNDGLDAKPMSDMSFGTIRIPVSRFADLWDETKTKPDFAYEVVDDQFEVLFSSDRRESISQLTTSTYYLLDQEQVEIVFVANIQSSLRGIFQYEFEIEQGLAIVDVVAQTNEETTRSLNWSVSDGRLKVFLDRAPKSSFRLIARCTWKPPTDQFPLPQIHATDSDQDRMILSRNSNLKIDIIPVGFNNSITTNSENLAPPFEWPRYTTFLSSWSKDDPDGRLEVKIRRIEPVVDGKLFVTFSENTEGQWHYTMECRVDVNSDFLDYLRLGMPSNWSTPNLDGLDGTLETSNGPNHNFQFLTIAPETPIDSTNNPPSRFWLDGLIKDSLVLSQQEIKPKVWIEQVPSIQRFICLPILEDGWEWRVRGLRLLQKVAEDDVPKAASPETHQFYEIVNDQYSIQRTQRSNLEVCTISSVVHHVWVDTSPLRAISHFMITAETNEQLTLSIPDATRIEQIIVNDSPVAIPGLAQPPKIRLPSSMQEQIVRVIWSARVSSNRETHELVLAAPRLYLGPGRPDELQPKTLETIWRIVESRPQIGRGLLVKPFGESDGDFHLPKMSSTETVSDDFWGSTSHFRFSGDQHTVIIGSEVPGKDFESMRVFVALGVFVIGIAAATNSRGNQGIEFAPWVYPLGVLFGLAWWLFLQPSIAGWGIVGFCLVMSWILR